MRNDYKVATPTVTFLVFHHMPILFKELAQYLQIDSL